MAAMTSSGVLQVCQLLDMPEYYKTKKRLVYVFQFIINKVNKFDK